MGLSSLVNDLVSLSNLCDAAEKNDFEKVEELMKKGASPYKEDLAGRYAVVRAAKHMLSGDDRVYRLMEEGIPSESAAVSLLITALGKISKIGAGNVTVERAADRAMIICSRSPVTLSWGDRLLEISSASKLAKALLEGLTINDTNIEDGIARGLIQSLAKKETLHKQFEIFESLKPFYMRKDKAAWFEDILYTLDRTVIENKEFVLREIENVSLNQAQIASVASYIRRFRWGEEVLSKLMEKPSDSLIEKNINYEGLSVSQAIMTLYGGGAFSQKDVDKLVKYIEGCSIDVERADLLDLAQKIVQVPEIMKNSSGIVKAILDGLEISDAALFRTFMLDTAISMDASVNLPLGTLKAFLDRIPLSSMWDDDSGYVWNEKEIVNLSSLLIASERTDKQEADALLASLIEKETHPSLMEKVKIYTYRSTPKESITAFATRWPEYFAHKMAADSQNQMADPSLLALLPDPLKEKLHEIFKKAFLDSDHFVSCGVHFCKSVTLGLRRENSDLMKEGCELLASSLIGKKKFFLDIKRSVARSLDFKGYQELAPSLAAFFIEKGDRATASECFAAAAMISAVEPLSHEWASFVDEPKCFMPYYLKNVLPFMINRSNPDATDFEGIKLALKFGADPQGKIDGRNILSIAIRPNEKNMEVTASQETLTKIIEICGKIDVTSSIELLCDLPRSQKPSSKIKTLISLMRKGFADLDKSSISCLERILDSTLTEQFKKEYMKSVGAYVDATSFHTLSYWNIKQISEYLTKESFRNGDPRATILVENHMLKPDLTSISMLFKKYREFGGEDSKAGDEKFENMLSNHMKNEATAGSSTLNNIKYILDCLPNLDHNKYLEDLFKDSMFYFSGTMIASHLSSNVAKMALFMKRADSNALPIMEGLSDLLSENRNLLVDGKVLTEEDFLFVLSGAEKSEMSANHAPQKRTKGRL